MKREKIINRVLAVFFTILSLAWIYPMVMILMNSFKQETTITTSTAFDLVTSENSAGFANYIAALEKQGFLAAFGYSLVITVTSVVLILVCCSMCAWFKRSHEQHSVLPVCFLDGSAFPDAYVYAIQYGKYAWI